MSLSRPLISAILTYEENDLRFERACADWLSATEGVPVVTTSRSYDRGRDGRSASTQRHIAVCATLNPSGTKIADDIGVLQGSELLVEDLFYCSPKLVSEASCEKEEIGIKALWPTLRTVTVLGLPGLCDLALQHEHITLTHYRQDLEGLAASLTTIQASPHLETAGLRLALITQTGDALTLRDELLKRLILEALWAHPTLTIDALSAALATYLHLSGPFPSQSLEGSLHHLQANNLITVVSDSVSLTPIGRDAVVNVPEEASLLLLEGRSAIRDELTKLTGRPFDDNTYNQIWDTLQDGLAKLFVAHGLNIIAAVAKVLNRQGPTLSVEERDVLDSLGARVERHFKEPQVAREVHQALMDIFSEPDSKAFGWLAQICSTYVMLCSLGLEPVSNSEVSNVLRTLHLLPDSDVVISLLCIGEYGHERIKALLEHWVKIGAGITLATPVLEEVAYHAWLGERSYRIDGARLGSMSDEDARRLVVNAFVRSFRKHAKDAKIDTGQRHWISFIREFRGATEFDHTRILQILKEDLRSTNLLSDFGLDVRMIDGIRERLERKSIRVHADRATGDPIGEGPTDAVRAKCRRDARLLAMVRRERQDGKKIVILTSARLLRAVGREIGLPDDAIIKVSELGTMLSLVPDARISLPTLRSALFDMGLGQKLTELQKLAYGVIAASGRWTYPWSRRFTLQGDLEKQLRLDAKRSGQTYREIEEKVLSVEDPSYAAEKIGRLLEGLAAPTKDEIRLRAQVAEYKKQFDQLSERTAARQHGKAPGGGAGKKGRKKS